ncbi:phosphatidylinositol N-acetylglucosaminyltransferase subunit P [Contarinia nasturtii]|uniref:phosphatidylinositol N-acetylglucosaminyltransferase subunit P n=1 Tax=Contarinia nasturtii TaxID=265458 RepID=UPI0012D498BE|nr:phosphatidylinositol N-acetylglucosaminyltransferase subunit P [Contarinia nasturtii]
MAEPTPSPTPYRAVYGFACFLFFKTLFFLYVCWTFIPEHILHNVLGLTYLPDKYFALFLPVLVLCALTIFAFLIYPSMNLSMQDDVNDLHTLRDKHTIVRCQRINQTTGIQCKNKVDAKPADASNNFNPWLFEKYCNDHMDHLLDSIPTDEENETEFCDCVNESKCWLHNHPNHLKVLQKRTTVPNICDLDVSDVCKRLFLEE